MLVITGRVLARLSHFCLNSEASQRSSAHVEGTGQPEDAARLSDVGWTMTDASLCGLGQTAAWAVQSAMKLWPEMFSA